jgi:AcrR family transcriptional regulator/DNA-binding MarR family transcriptional regulator
VSRRTFYDVFADREDCFLAVFEESVARAQALMVDAYERERGASWREKARAGLSALLGFLDGEPGMRSLLIVDALQAGPRVLRARAEILKQLGVAIQEGGSSAKSTREFPPLTGEGVVGAVFSVIHSHLLAERAGSLLDLLNPLMAMVVLPYLGPAAAQKELERSVPKPARATTNGRGSSGRSPFLSVNASLAELPMRLTYRTMRVLSAIGEQPGASNRQVGEIAGTSDQGQISKLLLRIQKLGLIENVTGQKRSQPTGEPNAWRLTPFGEEIWKTVIVSPSLGATDRRVVNQ